MLPKILLSTLLITALGVGLPADLSGESPPKLDGAWEANYRGPRVEISGNTFVRLWMNAPVLTTTFTLEPDGDGYLLELAENELAYQSDGRVYATVKSVRYENGELTMVDDFPITGESTDTLRPTKNSRYGNVTVMDTDFLKSIQGRWKTADGGMVLYFSGDMLEYGYDDEPSGSVKICAVKDNSSGEYRIVNADPAIESIWVFGTMRLEGERIITYIPVMDAPSYDVVFYKCTGSEAGLSWPRY